MKVGHHYRANFWSGLHTECNIASEIVPFGSDSGSVMYFVVEEKSNLDETNVFSGSRYRKAFKVMTSGGMMGWVFFDLEMLDGLLNNKKWISPLSPEYFIEEITEEDVMNSTGEATNP
jgi:hypothetical protein